ncbi:hypothetical protein EVAR_89887_1 [Eumeta japonica]|uniref:Uncharacterized protein n=1 Tax=Eumeta variegata TaxID=151549 RepID=A0A4C1YSR8_EUMVA|nr:hypothetical protein EVAR_89887_1 [Eumeta japonica]
MTVVRDEFEIKSKPNDDVDGRLTTASDLLSWGRRRIRWRAFRRRPSQNAPRRRAYKRRASELSDVSGFVNYPNGRRAALRARPDQLARASCGTLRVIAVRTSVFLNAPREHVERNLLNNSLSRGAAHREAENASNFVHGRFLPLDVKTTGKAAGKYPPGDEEEKKTRIDERGVWSGMHPRAILLP